MCINSEGRAIVWNMQPVMIVIRPFCLHQKIVPKGCLLLPLGYIYMYEIKQNIIQNNEAKGIFLELVQNDGNNKSFKMLPELVLSGCMPMPWGLFQIFMSDLFPDPSLMVWVTAYTALSAHVFPSSNSAYPQHSGEQYNGTLVKVKAKARMSHLCNLLNDFKKTMKWECKHYRYAAHVLKLAGFSWFEMI